MHSIYYTFYVDNLITNKPLFSMISHTLEKFLSFKDLLTLWKILNQWDCSLVEGFLCQTLCKDRIHSETIMIIKYRVQGIKIILTKGNNLNKMFSRDTYLSFPNLLPGVYWRYYKNKNKKHCVWQE